MPSRPPSAAPAHAPRPRRRRWRAAGRRRRRGSARRSACRDEAERAARAAGPARWSRGIRSGRTAWSDAARPTLAAAGAAIRPPPRQRSPSYRTQAWPGAIAQTGRRRSRRSSGRRAPARPGVAGRTVAGDERRAVPDPDLGPERRATAVRVAAGRRSPAMNVPPSSGIVARLEVLAPAEHDRVGRAGRSARRSAARRARRRGPCAGPR